MSAEDVSEQVSDLLRDYPELILDFNKFLPIRPRIKRNRSTFYDSDGYRLVDQQHRDENNNNASSDEKQDEKQDLIPEEAPSLERKDLLWKADLTDDEFAGATQGGFSDDDDDRRSPVSDDDVDDNDEARPPQEQQRSNDGKSASPSKEDDEFPGLTIVDDPELTRLAVAAHAGLTSSSCDRSSRHHLRVDTAVQRALDGLTVPSSVVLHASSFFFRHSAETRTTARTSTDETTSA